MFAYEKVDFHIHYLTSTYKEYLYKQYGAFPDGFPTPAWDLDNQIKFMSGMNIRYALLGMSSPDFCHHNQAETKVLVERSNDEISELLKGYEGKLGYMAALPLPNISDTLSEIERVLERGAKGFSVCTHADGVYLGQPELDPIIERLNERKAIVAIHPTQPSSVPGNVCGGLPIPAMEFLFDTTRTVVNMSGNNIFQRFPDIKWIVPHAGSFLPVLSDRIQVFFDYYDNKPNIFSDLKHVYYDIAGFVEPKLLEMLLRVAPVDHILYGSDFPHTPAESCKMLAISLESTQKLNHQEKLKIFSENASRIQIMSKE